MNTYTFIVLLAAFVFPKSASKTLAEQEKDAKKYIDQDSLNEVLKKMNSSITGYGIDWIYMPDGKGVNHKIFLTEKKHKMKYKKKSGLRKNSDSETDTKTVFNEVTFEDLYDCMTFELFTRDKPEGEVVDVKNFMTSSFNPEKFTKIITHGWLSDANSSVVVNIRKAYLEAKDVNVFGIDWNCIANDITYVNAAGSTSVVGKFIGKFIDDLVLKMKADYKKFHLIGHSLGAHVAGFAGNSTKSKIGRITGLDPALPGFETVTSVEGRLDPEDADFVDVIHTCSGVLGLSILAGHADFYPNGGSPSQPGCGWSFFFLGGGEACSHARAHEYFAESIVSQRFRAVKCDGWNYFKENKCEEDQTIMGEYVSTTARGPYYLKTATSTPFALDTNGIVFEP